MRIAITSYYLPSGSKIGVGYMVHYFANHLVQRGHDVTVFSSCGTSDDALYKTVQVACGKRFTTFRFAWNLRQIDFSKFDVLNAHGDDQFLWGCKRPRHIHTYHGSCFSEMLHATSLSIRARMGLLALGELGSAYLADERVAVSENTRQTIPRINSVIPNGVDLNVFTPGNSRKSERPSILFVGTLHGRKRGTMLLDIFQREILPAVPEAELWAVCGDSLQMENVHAFERVSKDYLIDLYQRAWVFCLPSTYEGFGVPYIEAMACGTPVVATPNVGAREVTNEGRCGWLATDEELGSALLRVITEPDLRNKMREAGLRRAQEFGWDVICERYENLYRGNQESVHEEVIR